MKPIHRQTKFNIVDCLNLAVRHCFIAWQRLDPWRYPDLKEALAKSNLIHLYRMACTLLASMSWVINLQNHRRYRLSWASLSSRSTGKRQAEYSRTRMRITPTCYKACPTHWTKERWNRRQTLLLSDDTLRRSLASLYQIKDVISTCVAHSPSTSHLPSSDHDINLRSWRTVTQPRDWTTLW